MDEIKETGKWYDDVPYQECKEFINTKLQSMTRDYIAIGYYLKYVRDHELYLEDGYKDIFDFADREYGMKKPTVNHCIKVNTEFSVDGNSPIPDEKYISFSRSQLQELLYVSEDDREKVTPEMTVKEIRDVRKNRLDVESEHESDIVDEVHNKLEVYKTDVALEDTHEKEEVQEVLHFTVAKEGYGAMIAELIGNYLDNAYTSPDRECEASVFGQTYKVLKRPEVTVFYTADGRTFFDVENVRLEQEYQWRQKNKPEPDIPEIEETEVFAPAQQEPEQIPGEVIGFEEDEEDEEDNLTQEWPELLVDIPVFDERTIKDFLLDEERDLEEYLKVDGLPFKVLSRKQMTVAGLRLLLGLVRGEDEHE